MKDYEYSLDKSSKKYICPACGKKSFVVYVDRYGKMLDASVGACDRYDKCHHHYKPKEYFADRRPFSGGHSSTSRQRNPYALRPAVKPDRPRTPDTLHPDVLAPLFATPYENNTLYRALLSRLQKYVSADTLRHTFERYLVGTMAQADGSPVFPQMDRQHRLRTAKMMRYAPDGHRKGGMQWLHTTHAHLRVVPPGGAPVTGEYRLAQCYFGTHLIEEMPMRTHTTMYKDGEMHTIALDEPEPQGSLWVFESEKTALIASAVLRQKGVTDIVAVATSGCNGLNASADNLGNPWHALQGLRNMHVTLFPDNGKYAEWYAHARALRTHCRSIWVTDIMERDHTYAPIVPGYRMQPGDDFGDLLLAWTESLPAGQLPIESDWSFLRIYNAIRNEE